MKIPDDVVRQLNELPIEEVAERLGIAINRHSAICFMHNDHTPSLKFSVEKNLCFCFVCGEGGGPIQLVKRYNAWSFCEACAWLSDQFNIGCDFNKRKQKSIRQESGKRCLHRNNAVAHEFDAELFTWLIDNARLSPKASKFLFEERRLKMDIIDKLSVKSLSYPNRLVDELLKRFGEERCLGAKIVRRGKNGFYCFFYTPCLLFPYYGQDGRLKGVQSRYLGENKNAPRFQFLSSQSTRLFNLPVLNTLKQGDVLYISEGITDCLAMLSAGMSAVAIPSATILPLEDLVLLKKYDLRMYPDQDVAGLHAFKELKHFFVNHYSTIRAERLPEGFKDYCDYYAKHQGAAQEDGIHL